MTLFFIAAFLQKNSIPFRTCAKSSAMNIFKTSAEKKHHVRTGKMNWPVGIRQGGGDAFN